MADELNLNIFDFLIHPIRDKDKDEGADFVRRFLEGPQTEWERTLATIESIKNLWSVTDCPDEFLQYLKRIVGWTPDLDHITEDLDYEALRRLIAVSVPLWKNRTTEYAIIDVLNILVPARVRIWNWFQLRWVLDVDYLGLEEWQGRDPWSLDVGGPYWMNVRVMDNPLGTVDRDLIRGVLNLMRPCGERFQIVYLNFLDLFEQDGDLLQWSQVAAAPLATDPVVAGGMLQLLDTSQDEFLYADVEDADVWQGMMVTARLRHQTTGVFVGPGFFWYFDPATVNGYFVTISAMGGPPNDSYLYFGYITGGTPTTLWSVDLSNFGIVLEVDRWYSVRVQCTVSGATNRIKIYLDGEEIIDTTDATYTQGGVALGHTVNSDMECDEIEVMPLPAQTDTVEINE